MTTAPAHMACRQPATKDSWAARISACAPSAATRALAMPSRAASAAASGTPPSRESMAPR